MPNWAELVSLRWLTGRDGEVSPAMFTSHGTTAPPRNGRSKTVHLGKRAAWSGPTTLVGREMARHRHAEPAITVARAYDGSPSRPEGKLCGVKSYHDIPESDRSVAGQSQII